MLRKEKLMEWMWKAEVTDGGGIQGKNGDGERKWSLERGRNGVGENGMWLGEGTRLVRIGGVEGLEKVRSVSELRSGEPGGFFISAFITSPANKVKEFALAAFVDLGVKDFTDLILEFAFNLDRRRR